MSATSEDTRKTVLITGAGVGGIGGELAKQFHSRGYRVFAAVRRLETVKELEELGVESVYLDVTDPSSIAAARDEVAARTSGKLNVLVNNAGQGSPRPATDLEIETTVKGIFDVNVFGVMRVVQTFVNLLVSAAGDGEEATIVNIGSIAPIVPLVFGSAYNASKAALHAYADCLRMELRPYGIHVLTAMTGGVRSSIVRRTASDIPQNSLYRPIYDSWLKRIGLSQSTPMDTATYAKGLVDEVVRGSKKPWFWRGHFAWRAWFLNTFLWKGFTDYFMMKRFGLVKLENMMNEQRKLKSKQKQT
ncbi:hypothetical protein FPQ18DRAFT_15367 [Pyronema domesticum]|nr:hypothetical protein FPQ18DRAFT_15367 [Pyronema domesticum]